MNDYDREKLFIDVYKIAVGQDKINPEDIAKKAVKTYDETFKRDK